MQNAVSRPRKQKIPKDTGKVDAELPYRFFFFRHPVMGSAEEGVKQLLTRFSPDPMKFG